MFRGGIIKYQCCWNSHAGWCLLKVNLCRLWCWRIAMVTVWFISLSDSTWSGCVLLNTSWQIFMHDRFSCWSHQIEIYSVTMKSSAVHSHHVWKRLRCMHSTRDHVFVLVFFNMQMCPRAKKQHKMCMVNHLHTYYALIWKLENEAIGKLENEAHRNVLFFCV